MPNAAIPGQWVNVIDLRVGDVLFTHDGRPGPVTNVSVRRVKITVHNLQVEGLQNHRVGSPSALVHNSSGSPTPGYSQLQTKGNPIGSGAEGTVYDLPGYPDWVLKEFKPGTVATQARNEANNLDALRRVFGDRHVVQTVAPPSRFAPGQPVVLLKQKVTIVIGGEDQAALKVIVDTLQQNNITADLGKNLVWGHSGDGIPRWIWIE